MTEKPTVLSPVSDGIPTQLKAHDRWIVWRLEWREPKNGKPGRWNKTPYNAGSGRLASSTDPQTWCTFNVAWDAYQQSLTSKQPYSGIGFMLGDGWTGIDLDGCRAENGDMEKWARDALARIHGYTEVSVSGTGAHVICQGSVPPGKRQRDDATREHTGIAIYDKGRYFAVSGRLLPESQPIADQTTSLAALHAWLFKDNHREPPPVSTDDLITHARRAKDGAKFGRLWDGQWEGDYGSQSEADLALCMKLAFWTRRDAGLIDSYFRRSGLMRDKWNREQYRTGTIAKAIETTTETWNPHAHVHNGREYASQPQSQPPETPSVIEEAAPDIYAGSFLEPAAMIDQILYPGITVFAGKSKLGKSWFTTQLALAIAGQTKLADYFEVMKPGRVLYLSLEESRPQTKKRLHMLMPSMSDFLQNVHYVYEMAPLLTGGAAALDAHLEKHPAEVVIVDSLLAFVRQAGRKNVDVMQADYNVVNTLRAIAVKHGIALIIVAHTRKAPGDAVDTVQGTMGLVAAADAVWVLNRDGNGNVVLTVTGRDVYSTVFGLTQVRDGGWKVTGEGDEVKQGLERREILDLLRENGPMRVVSIARALHKSVSNISNLLSKLAGQDLVTRSKHGTYFVQQNQQHPSSSV
jgi:DNA-binding transcriptional ArsR family regulator